MQIIKLILRVDNFIKKSPDVEKCNIFFGPFRPKCFLKISLKPRYQGNNGRESCPEIPERVGGFGIPVVK